MESKGENDNGHWYPIIYGESKASRDIIVKNEKNEKKCYGKDFYKTSYFFTRTIVFVYVLLVNSK
ncbi:hypothetical protein D3C86_1389620 [compost metagenome]